MCRSADAPFRAAHAEHNGPLASQFRDADPLQQELVCPGND
jgi:hypothetical protein